MARTPGGCAVDDCDGKHIGEDRCHFCDRPHRCKGFCGKHYERHRRGTPLEPADIRTKRSTLTADDVRQIRHLRHTELRRPSHIARQFGVTIGAITNICARRTWADVD
ncbi:hypothetical protein [Mycolicibacterium porcinum]|uniref:Transposase n=1 Tax=Mycolicibacterium porcinum TaxID=39693 RepID=A0ABV3VI84_9MYCO